MESLILNFGKFVEEFMKNHPLIWLFIVCPIVAALSLFILYKIKNAIVHILEIIKRESVDKLKDRRIKKQAEKKRQEQLKQFNEAKERILKSEFYSKILKSIPNSPGDSIGKLCIKRDRLFCFGKFPSVFINQNGDPCSDVRIVYKELGYEDFGSSTELAFSAFKSLLAEKYNLELSNANATESLLYGDSYVPRGTVKKNIEPSPLKKIL